MSERPSSGLVLVGHGSTLNPDSSAPTFQHADEIKRRRLFAEVHCAFWKEEPGLREVLRMVECQDVYVVPNFISEGYFTETIIPRELELTGHLTRRGSKLIKYCEPVGKDYRMTDLLLHRAREVAPSVDPGRSSLLIVAHGTNLNERSAEAARFQAESIRAKKLYAEVSEAYMEEAPLIAKWMENTSQPNVIVVPFFIADGLHSYQDIPVLLGIESDPTGAASQSEVFRRNPYELYGRKLFYAGSIGTEKLMVDVILDTVERFDEQHRSALVT
ncbi:MAG: cobalamin biosynthesis protein CbiX [Verrucomicrobia bacterium]|nr:cobalamin biosynthesis protein CbiX [Verrucomicrobiota bacterium]